MKALEKTCLLAETLAERMFSVQLIATVADMGDRRDAKGHMRTTCKGSYCQVLGSRNTACV